MSFKDIYKQKWFVPAVAVIVVAIAAVIIFTMPKGQKSTESKVMTPKTTGQKLTAKEAWTAVSAEFTKWAADVSLTEVFSTTRAGETGLEGKPVGWDFKAYSKSLGEELSYFVGLDGELVQGSKDKKAESELGSPIFTIADWVIDSSAAFTTADVNGGSDLKGTANYDAVYDLKLDKTSGNLIWTLYYPSPSKAKFTALIDAKSGELLRTSE